MVETEQCLRQLRFVVALLEFVQRVLEPVQGRLDLTGGPAHTGLRGRVDAGALRGQLGPRGPQHVLQGEAQRCSGGLWSEGAGDGHVRVGQTAGGGGQALRRQMLHFDREHPRQAVKLAAQGGDLRALRGPLASRPYEPAAEGERGQRAGRETTGHQVR